MNDSTFEELLQENKDRVFSHAFYVLGNRDDAEDVTQEVFIKLWENLAEIDSSKYRAWIMSVAHNRCIDRARERQRSLSRSVELDSAPMVEITKVTDEQTDPVSLLEFRETQRSLLRALKRLPAKMRSMLVLHYYHGFKYHTIGEMFDMNVNTVKVEVHRGRKKLREVLANEFPERARNA
jgi:RNA polymerase sigma-70 factor (ECF subfamily)